jgi:hypothetical protein
MTSGAAAASGSAGREKRRATRSGDIGMGDLRTC